MWGLIDALRSPGQEIRISFASVMGKGGGEEGRGGEEGAGVKERRGKERKCWREGDERRWEGERQRWEG